MPQTALPTALPTDRTASTYSATNIKAFILKNPNQTVLTTATVTTGATVTATAATSITVTALTDPIPTGATLDFLGVKATLTADAAQGATTLAVTALSGPIAAGTSATYLNYDEVPLTEDNIPTLGETEETIKIRGRLTPLRSVNEKDFTAMLKTVAGLDDPTVKRLFVLGVQISPFNRARVMWVMPDGLVFLCLVNIGVGKTSGAVGTAVRYDFSANLTGDCYWGDRNETTFKWYKLGAAPV